MATALTETQILGLVRKAIRQVSPTTVKNDDISTSIEVAIDILGQALVGSDPQYFTKQMVLQSPGLTNVFDIPSDLFRLRWVKDLGQKAGMITGATNASPIVITCLNHGFEDDDRVTIVDVTGNTAANGTWVVQYIDEDSFSLFNSEGNGDYTAPNTGVLFDSEGSPITDESGDAIDTAYGGFVFKADDEYPIFYQTPSANASKLDSTYWYASENKIYVDNPLFDNDILISYTYRPDAISEIPAEFHQLGLVSYAVIDNLEIPPTKSERFADLKMSYDRHRQRWELAMDRAGRWRMASETRNVNLSQRVTRSMI